MNQKYTTLVIASIVAAVAMTAVAFAIPAPALAHYGHNHGSSIKVSQDISQANQCSSNATSTNATTCVNSASNSADIDR